ncbi:MAG: NYN domain-containing protein [Flavobacterium sp.]|nr:NYN domain-containing protein [Flavobacterium sp.]
MIGNSLVSTRSNGNLRRLMVFIDGENMVFNFQATLKEKSKNRSVIHKKDVYVWHPHTFNFKGYDVIRFNYYTFCVGDDKILEENKTEIKSLSFTKDIISVLPTSIRPSVFKKNKQGKKTKGVDIQMAVDILSNVYNDNLDTVLLVTGDGDFLPIINEIIRNGKQVILASFKSGLNKDLLNHIDDYFELDQIYFESI